MTRKRCPYCRKLRGQPGFDQQGPVKATCQSCQSKGLDLDGADYKQLGQWFAEKILRGGDAYCHLETSPYAWITVDGTVDIDDHYVAELLARVLGIPVRPVPDESQRRLLADEV